VRTSTPPDRTEAAEYYFTYIDQVGPGDIRDLLDQQAGAVQTLLDGVSEEQSLTRYAPDKWTMREALGHINDTERLFLFRAFWFARGFDSPLPSFDEKVAVGSSGANALPWSDHLDEFRAVRAGTSRFFRHLPEVAWMRRGTASGYPFTVRALAYLAAGHVEHHLRIFRERYLVVPR
jgi:hypothetical protein